DRHVEAVGADRRDAAITEEERLQHKGDRRRDHGRPGAEHDRRQSAAHTMRRGAAGDGHIEHHDRERESGKDRKQWHHAPAQRLAHLLSRDDPEWRRGSVHDAASRGAEVTVRYVHYYYLFAVICPAAHICAVKSK